MAQFDNAGLVREAFEAFNAKDLARAQAVNAPGARALLVPFGQTVGLDEYFQAWASAFPDGTIEIIQLVSQGDTVVAEYIGRGTQTGALNLSGQSIPPTNQRGEVRFVEIYEVRNGKLAGLRSYFDSATMFRQLGLAPERPAQMARPAAPEVEVRH